MVSGGASGIGRATAFGLASGGAAVGVVDLQEDAAEEVVGIIRRGVGVPCPWSAT